MAVVNLRQANRAIDFPAILIEIMAAPGSALRVVLERIGVQVVAAHELVERAVARIAPAAAIPRPPPRSTVPAAVVTAAPGPRALSSAVLIRSA